MQTLEILTVTCTSRVVRGQSSLKDVLSGIFLERIESRTLKSHESLVYLVCLVC